MLNAQSQPWTIPSLRLPSLARRLAKFSIVGASGVAVNLAVFTLLSAYLHMQYLLAGALAIEAAMCSNYVLNNQWTFADRRMDRFPLAGLTRYHVASFGGMLINLAMLFALASWLSLPPIAANVAGIACATGWNFSLSVCWTWRRP